MERHTPSGIHYAGSHTGPTTTEGRLPTATRNNYGPKRLQISLHHWILRTVGKLPRTTHSETNSCAGRIDQNPSRTVVPGNTRADKNELQFSSTVRLSPYHYQNGNRSRTHHGRSRGRQGSRAIIPILYVSTIKHHIADVFGIMQGAQTSKPQGGKVTERERKTSGTAKPAVSGPGKVGSHITWR